MLWRGITQRKRKLQSQYRPRCIDDQNAPFASKSVGKTKSTMRNPPKVTWSTKTRARAALRVLHVWDLTAVELDDMGPLIGSASVVVRRLTDCDQCYVCLWSHSGFAPSHIHYVIQPVSNEMRLRYDNAGPSLQVEMFRLGELPANELVEAFCDRARAEFQRAM
jgi:hypothetical protein